MVVLDIENLSISFRRYAGGLRQEWTRTVEDISLQVKRGEAVAIIGASGSGKSLLAHAVMGLLPRNAAMSGTIRYNGNPLNEAALRQLRGRDILFVPQSVTFLDPLLTVGSQLSTRSSGQEAHAKRRGLLRRLGLGETAERLYPFQLSGGMARKVLLATASSSEAKLIIADEPTPGMGADDARESLRHLRELADAGAAVLFITHDIEAALRAADRVVMLYDGMAVETAQSSDFRGDGESLRHPYSRALWRALPQNGFQPLPESRATASENGCFFASWCQAASAQCGSGMPPPRAVRGGIARCHHAT
ncbi:ABC transporter ATP-binding protein [Paenibacillus sp. J5C_2022]|nr:ABC transporter ATP-binding protein [Paenibacillus sp. J5C2022]MCU6709560.1 ABC transporter ATP-binding protein [Paenibacillus sp. J5C2022]